MYRVAQLLERKQALLERRDRVLDAHGVAEIERALHHIDLELDQWEDVEAPLVPHQMASCGSKASGGFPTVRR